MSSLQGSVPLKVFLSPFVLSTVMLDNSNCPGDQEGFLIGNSYKSVRFEINDQSMCNAEEDLMISVFSAYPCGNFSSFYDNYGVINVEFVKNFLGDRIDSVVGWYRFRRNVPPYPSAREAMVHRNLMKIFSGNIAIGDNYFVYGVFGSSTSDSCATHTYDYAFYIERPDRFVPLVLSMLNLIDTKTKYRNGSLASSFVNSQTFDSVLNISWNFESCWQTEDGIQQMHKLLRDKCSTLSEELTASECVNASLEKDIERLEEELERLSTSEKNLDNLLPRLPKKLLKNRVSPSIAESTSEGEPATPLSGSTIHVRHNSGGKLGIGVNSSKEELPTPSPSNSKKRDVQSIMDDNGEEAPPTSPFKTRKWIPQQLNVENLPLPIVEQIEDENVEIVQIENCGNQNITVGVHIEEVETAEEIVIENDGNAEEEEHETSITDNDNVENTPPNPHLKHFRKRYWSEVVDFESEKKHPVYGKYFEQNRPQDNETISQGSCEPSDDGYYIVPPQKKFKVLQEHKRVIDHDYSSASDEESHNKYGQEIEEDKGDDLDAISLPSETEDFGTAEIENQPITVVEHTEENENVEVLQIENDDHNQMNADVKEEATSMTGAVLETNNSEFSKGS